MNFAEYKNLWTVYVTVIEIIYFIYMNKYSRVLYIYTYSETQEIYFQMYDLREVIKKCQCHRKFTIGHNVTAQQNFILRENNVSVTIFVVKLRLLQCQYKCVPPNTQHFRQNHGIYGLSIFSCLLDSLFYYSSHVHSNLRLSSIRR